MRDHVMIAVSIKEKVVAQHCLLLSYLSCLTLPLLPSFPFRHTVTLVVLVTLALTDPPPHFLSIFLPAPLLPASSFVCPPLRVPLRPLLARTASRTPRDTRCMSGSPLRPLSLSLSPFLPLFLSRLFCTPGDRHAGSWRGRYVRRAAVRRVKNPQKRERHKGRAHALKGNDASAGDGGLDRVVVADSPSLTLENSPRHATFTFFLPPLRPVEHEA